MGWCIYREIGTESSDRLRLVIDTTVHENSFPWRLDRCLSLISISSKWNVPPNSLKKIKSHGMKYGDWCRNIQADISNCGRNKT